MRRVEIENDVGKWLRVPFKGNRRFYMSKGNHRPAGGIGSKQRVSVPVKTGSGAHGIRPAHVAQRGVAIDPKSREARETRAPESRFGNEVALNVGKGGPGVGREVFRSGTQATHGPTVGENKPTAGGLIEGWETKQRPKA